MKTFKYISDNLCCIIEDNIFLRIDKATDMCVGCYFLLSTPECSCVGWKNFGGCSRVIYKKTERVLFLIDEYKTD